MKWYSRFLISMKLWFLVRIQERSRRLASIRVRKLWSFLLPDDALNLQFQCHKSGVVDVRVDGGVFCRLVPFTHGREPRRLDVLKVQVRFLDAIRTQSKLLVTIVAWRSAKLLHHCNATGVISLSVDVANSGSFKLDYAEAYGVEPMQLRYYVEGPRDFDAEATIDAYYTAVTRELKVVLGTANVLQ